MADIFVSYTSSDREWAEWIGHELIALGHKPHLHDWEVPAGGDFMKWMEERYTDANHILCVVSTTYLHRPYASLERRAAHWASLDRRPNFAIPVFIEPCEALMLFATLKRCDLHGLNEADARARLTAFLAPPGRTPRGVFPGEAKVSSRPPGELPSYLPSWGTANIFIRYTSSDLECVFPGEAKVSSRPQLAPKAE
jgi:hypothetical protein